MIINNNEGKGTRKNPGSWCLSNRQALNKYICSLPVLQVKSHSLLTLALRQQLTTLQKAANYILLPVFSDTENEILNFS